MTYKKAAQVILNTWNMMQDFDTEPQDIITGNSAFDIAMRMAYNALLEKENQERDNFIMLTKTYNVEEIRDVVLKYMEYFEDDIIQNHMYRILKEYPIDKEREKEK